MRRSEEVENYLHRVECSERNRNKESVPVAHGTIPKSRKLKSLELASLIALRADESCILINILEKVEAFPLVIVEAASISTGLKWVADARALRAWSSDMLI